MVTVLYLYLYPLYWFRYCFKLYQMDFENVISDLNKIQFGVKKDITGLQNVQNIIFSIKQEEGFFVFICTSVSREIQRLIKTGFPTKWRI